MAFCSIDCASVHALRCAVCFRKPFPFLEGLTSLPRAGLSKDRWQSPAWLIAHHACPLEHGGSLPERTRRPVSSGLCLHACPAWPVRSSFFQACVSPSENIALQARVLRFRSANEIPVVGC